MRLLAKEQEIIKSTISEIVDDAKIYLFGSRLDESKKGGDIDLFIVSKESSYQTKIKIKSKLEYLLRKPVDVLMHKDFNKEIEQIALKGIVL